MSTLLDIKNLIDANYPDNTTGLITPAKERQVLKALADFVVSSQGEVETAPFVWDAAFSYGDGDPVIYDQAWYLSLSAANLANQPDTSPLLWEPVNAFNTVLSLWEVNGVYIGELNIVLKDGKLYQLNRTLVGDVPFVSTDFDAELAAGEWINLLPDTKPVANTYADTTAMIAAQGAQVEGYLYKAGTGIYLYLGTTVGDISDYYQVNGSGATPTPPVAAVYADNAAMFAAQGAQITDYIYQSGTSFFRYKGTTVGDITDYVQIGGGGSSTPPVAATYASLAAMIAAQGSQISGYIYADDKAYYQYLGTTVGDVTDYRRLAPADIPSVDESYANTAAMIADQSNQLSGWLYFDGSDYWEYLGTTAGTIADYRLIGPAYPEASTSTVIDFTKPKTFGSFGTPITGAITESNTNAKRVVQVIFYSGASFTAPSANWKLSDNSAAYATSGVNIIYVEYFSDTYKRYWFDQDV